MKPTLLKYGIGYNLVVMEQQRRLVLGILCKQCGRISCHPKDVTERYCGDCKIFHEDQIGSQQA